MRINYNYFFIAVLLAVFVVIISIAEGALTTDNPDPQCPTTDVVIFIRTGHHDKADAYFQQVTRAFFDRIEYPPKTNIKFWSEMDPNKCPVYPTFLRNSFGHTIRIPKGWFNVRSNYWSLGQYYEHGSDPSKFPPAIFTEQQHDRAE